MQVYRRVLLSAAAATVFLPLPGRAVRLAGEFAHYDATAEVLRLVGVTAASSRLT
jgi:hypothetical protein